MSSRSSLLFVLCGFCYLGCREPIQPIHIGTIADQVESITVYDLSSSRRNEYTKQEWQEATREPIDLKIFREIAPHARYTKKNLVWKGGWLAVAKLRNGTQVWVALSFYGGFFRILGQPGYYVFDREEDRKKWNDEIHDRIFLKVFYPQRIKDQEIQSVQELRSRILPPQEEEEIQIQMKSAEATSPESAEPE